MNKFALGLPERVENDKATSRIKLPPPVPTSELPKFTQSRTISAPFPGNLTFLQSSLPYVNPEEILPLVTGIPGSTNVAVLKVSLFVTKK